jgi:hypothetical protein
MAHRTPRTTAVQPGIIGSPNHPPGRAPPKVWEPLRNKWEQRIDQNIAELKQLKIDLRRCTRDASR